jgi:bis(5'-nucleosidyl)-tetraphosphatase
MTTAFRETEEEAGLTSEQLKILDGFKKTLQYDVQGKSKRVVYWLAELRDPNTPVVLSNEHQDYKWLDLESAVEFAHFPDMQQTLREANAFIESYQKYKATVK